MLFNFVKPKGKQLLRKIFLKKKLFNSVRIYLELLSVTVCYFCEIKIQACCKVTKYFFGYKKFSRID